MAKVTVCIPTYNRKTQLEETLEALRNQTYKDFEVLVCNDGSSDGTREYLDCLRQAHLRVLHNDQNRNLPATMARLFQEASGEYIAIHHDHDPTTPEWLDYMVELMEAHPGAGMACCGCYQIADDGSRVEGPDRALYELFQGHDILPGQKLIATLATKAHTPLAATASVFRREVVAQAGGYLSDWFLASDEDLYRRVASLSDVAFCPIRLFTLSPRPRESAQHVGGWRGIYTIFEFRRDTTLRLWQASWLQRRWNLCRFSWLKVRALILDSLSLWLRGDREGLELALAWDRVPPLPTGSPPLPLLGKHALRLWIGILRTLSPVGVALGRWRRRLKRTAV